MIKIAIETTDGFSLSIDDNGDRRDFVQVEPENKTSELLWKYLSHIDNKSDIREIYISSGPANYTNLRIVYAFAMGVRKAIGAQIYTIPSFLAKADFLLAKSEKAPFMLVNYARNREYCYQLIEDADLDAIDWKNIHLADKEGIIELSKKYRCITNAQSYETLQTGDKLNLKAEYLFEMNDKYKQDNGLIYARASV